MAATAAVSQIDKKLPIKFKFAGESKLMFDAKALEELTRQLNFDDIQTDDGEFIPNENQPQICILAMKLTMK